MGAGGGDRHAGTAGMIRRLRANLLDELQKAYVVTARAKGLPPQGAAQVPAADGAQPVHRRHRNLLPHIISGAEIIAVVLSLPTTGPMLLNALKSQDMYLAGSFLMFLAFLIVVGVSCSDRRSSHWIRASACRPDGRPRMSEIGLTAGPAPPERARRASRAGEPIAALRLAGAVRSLRGRRDDARRTERLLPRRRDPADVVAAAPAPGGGGVRRGVCSRCT